MVLSITNHRSMLRGFADAGYACLQAPLGVANPVQLVVRDAAASHHFTLWVFDVTHGGGGPTVRAADEYRIQITNGPTTLSAYSNPNTTHVLIGYSPSRDVIVAYDRKWLEAWTANFVRTQSRGSPSIQVKEADILAGQGGMHRLLKNTQTFGSAAIVTLSPQSFPAFLLNQGAVLAGTMSGAQAMQTAVPPQSPTIPTLDQYCRSRGYSFDRDLLARYVASFLAKPFVILAGVSGTGKSKMAELVAEYYSLRDQSVPTAAPHAATPVPALSTGDNYVYVAPALSTLISGPVPGRFALIPVRPDWLDNQSIMGYVNPITQAYESTQALDLVLTARSSLQATTLPFDAPRHFMLLDEMNLARVEHYFSDWLSCSESRRLEGAGMVVQQPVPLHRSAQPVQATLSTGEVVEVPNAVPLPTNIVVTGTINVDETTYGISPKVLDRAMVIEFDVVNLDDLRGLGAAQTSEAYRFPSTLPPFALPSHTDYQALPIVIHEHLKFINAILEKARLHFGYRAANEMAVFIARFNDILPLETNDPSMLRALDAAVLQKVLPRLQGNRAKLEEMLVALATYLHRLDANAAPGTGLADESPSPLLPKSFYRCMDMLDTLRSFGFVSFFK